MKIYLCAFLTGQEFKWDFTFQTILLILMVNTGLNYSEEKINELQSTYAPLNCNL